MPLENGLDPLSLLPTWVAKEKDLAHMLPYVSLVNDQTVRTEPPRVYWRVKLSKDGPYDTKKTYPDLHG